jgi:hypothetical protein
VNRADMIGLSAAPRLPGSLPLEAALRNCRRILRQASGEAAVALSKVQSVDQRMRLECGVGFRQLRDVPSHSSGAAMCANNGHPSGERGRSPALIQKSKSQ